MEVKLRSYDLAVLDAHTRLPFRFGPLLLQGGERRLNVAITRARSSMTLVSSFTYFDMDADRCRGRRGLELLRGYLEFAAGGGFVVDSRNAQASGVVADIARSLREAGVAATTHEGASKYRIDLAVRERDSDGGGLAIETDGLAYHSGDSARDAHVTGSSAAARLESRCTEPAPSIRLPLQRAVALRCAAIRLLLRHGCPWIPRKIGGAGVRRKAAPAARPVHSPSFPRFHGGTDDLRDLRKRL